MSYFPLNYEKINQMQAYDMPSTLKQRNNKAYCFWERALYERAMYSLKFNVPKEWEGPQLDLMRYTLFRVGFGAIMEDKKFGKFFQPVGLKGMGFFYQPTGVILSNPMLQKEYSLDQAAIIKISPDFRGIWDIIDYYALKLSLLDVSMNTNLTNTKNSFMLFAKTKGAAETLKVAMDLVNRGETAAVYDKRVLLPDDNVTGSEPIYKIDFNPEANINVAQGTYELVLSILSSFDNEVGISTLPYGGAQKKERMVVSEAESKKVESQARVTVWVETIQQGFNRANELFDLDLSVELRNDMDNDTIPEEAVE